MAEAHPIPNGPKFKDRTGQKYGRLTVTAYAGLRGKHPQWTCLCECGNTKIVAGTALAGSLTRSCGCLLRETTIRRSFRHGGSPSSGVRSEYAIYLGVRDRCYNKADHAYERYGGRGITMCERWLASFANFLADVGERPSSAHSLDRFPDNNGHYEPGNVRWATNTQQARNKRNNRLISHNGRTLCLAEWAEITGIKTGTILQRLNNGWTIDESLTLPPRQSNRYTRRHE